MDKFLNRLNSNYARMRLETVEKTDLINDKFVTVLNKMADNSFKDTYEEADYVISHYRFIQSESSSTNFSELEKLFFSNFIDIINEKYYNTTKNTYEMPVSCLNKKDNLDIMLIIEMYVVKFIKDKGYSKVLLMLDEETS